MFLRVLLGFSKRPRKDRVVQQIAVSLSSDFASPEPHHQHPHRMHRKNLLTDLMHLSLLSNNLVRQK